MLVVCHCFGYVKAPLFEFGDIIFVYQRLVMVEALLDRLCDRSADARAHVL